MLMLGVYLSIGCLHARVNETRDTSPRFSTAGFFQLDNSGRQVYNMNVAWRLLKGDVKGAETVDFDDSSWSVVSLPNGIETIPDEASGCTNYQGVAWYRKHFDTSQIDRSQKVFLHFEGIMGKSKIYFNGELLKTQYGGYLPVSVDVSALIKWGDKNLIAVCADNSNDPLYPPGKVQEHLDFTYFGGIYRDCWLITHADTYITDPNFEDKKASGGLLIAFDKVSEVSSDILLRLHLRNDNSKSFKGNVEFAIRDKNNNQVHQFQKSVSFKKEIDINSTVKINNPKLWSPQDPHLYYIDIRLKNKEGEIVDGYTQRFGIRSIEFKGGEGFWLNGKPYHEPLVGGNRHQDYALVGNAVSNNAHWRDAKKMRDAGFRLVRNAHYPQDPAFMDACDELGLFVIVNTPGWQFWNEDPIFEQRVYKDIRNMVRRDRNHASIWLWEPILNETWYPDHFAKKTKDIVKEEFPYKNSYSASDQRAHGSEHFDIHFAHTDLADSDDANRDISSDKTYFTREWGDNVDDWSSHNSTSRAARGWGEVPMLVQAQHYAAEDFPYSTLDVLYLAWNKRKQAMGGALWHTFDHQRGYHPDPFYGGIMDIYRQPKTSFYMFQSQQAPGSINGRDTVGGIVHIAHEMTPFSPKDVVVYSNCDEVRLRFTSDGELHTWKRDKSSLGMKHPPIVFKDIYDFMVDKSYARSGRHNDSYILAEGYIDGKLVATDKVMPSRRPTQIILSLDDNKTGLTADGSDFITVIASVADQNGIVKRLNNYKIIFSVEGEGELINTNETGTNPVQVEWGTAPALIRSTATPGEIKVKARVLWEGSQMPMDATLVINSIPSPVKCIYDSKEKGGIRLNQQSSIDVSQDKLGVKKINLSELEEVQKQQTEFGEDR